MVWSFCWRSDCFKRVPNSCATSCEDFGWKQGCDCHHGIFSADSPLRVNCCLYRHLSGTSVEQTNVHDHCWLPSSCCVLVKWLIRWMGDALSSTYSSVGHCWVMIQWLERLRVKEQSFFVWFGHNTFFKVDISFCFSALQFFLFSISCCLWQLVL